MSERQLKELVLLVYRYEQYRGGEDTKKKMFALIDTVKNLPDKKLDSMIHGAVDTLENFIGIKIWEDKK